MSRCFSCSVLLATALVTGTRVAPARAADPPVPSAAHPRLFMSATNLAGLSSNARTPGTSAARIVARCQDSIDHAEFYAPRGGVDADTWPGSAVACAFAYLTLNDAKYLTPALKYWKAALNDDQNIGDSLGCTAANDTFEWKNQWDGNYPPPPVLVTVTHDTGYPMRWYGPFLALTYDWLYSAPGVDEALRAQTRTCLTAWIDNYTLRGYLHDQAGFNYNAGYVIAKTLAAIAIGTDGGADGHLWTETIHDVFEKLLVAQGLAGSGDGLGAPAGNMVGGDWGSWQYGPLSVAEYAAATRAMEENGVAQPALDAWLNSVAVRTVYGTLPKMDAQYTGNGDFDSENVYPAPNSLQADAVLLGPSNDQAAAWARFPRQSIAGGSSYIWSALAELRNVMAQDYRSQTPAPPLWYVARGTGSMYVRTAWDENAFWGVFMSAPSNADHQHFAASNFVFSKGGDHLIVDPSNYGEPDTFETNAVSADASTTPGDYQFTQTPWSHATLPWARGTSGGVFAARADFAHAYDFQDTPSDVRYAQREWVLFPEGEIVTIDRVHTSDPSRGMYLNLHANTGGTLKLDASVASGTVGGSGLAIHPILLSGGTPTLVKPPVGSCKVSCSFPCGACTAARFPVDEYSIKVPGPWSVAIHVIDGLGAGEKPAQVGSLNDDNFDPAPKQNGGVIGAAVYRGAKQSYVLASSAQDGASGATMSYGVPGGSPARHIVFDAAEAGDHTSAVTASVQAGRCVVSIGAGSGGGIAGRPLMFQVAAAADGCTVKADTDVAPGMPPPGGGVNPQPGADGGPAGADGGPGPGVTPTGGATGGCGCATSTGSMRVVLPVALLFAAARRRRRP